MKKSTDQLVDELFEAIFPSLRNKENKEEKTMEKTSKKFVVKLVGKNGPYAKILDAKNVYYCKDQSVNTVLVKLTSKEGKPFFKEVNNADIMICGE